ncbi:unnamed protein product [Echinostoma caproni]|uniref:SH2 domain-containing protein n=1 Tax=Echinostoma caproni TaxID=27848 RepID=A0A183B0I5_9TREM|nr:unnamed protein product [Echinostoma caproni]
MNNTDMCGPLDEYKKQVNLLSREPWYHYDLSRDESEKRVRRNGEFLVRSSAHTPGDFVLTYKWNGKVAHILIKQRARKGDSTEDSKSFLYSFGVVEFPSVAQLIKYHWTNQLPMAVSSEAVIFRPVHYVGVKHEQGLPWKLGQEPLSTHRNSPSSQVTPISRAAAKLNGLAGSVSDVRARFVSNNVEPSIKRASLLDLRGTTYMDPMLLDDIDYCPPETLDSSLGSFQMRSSQNSLFDTGALTQSSEAINIKNMGLSAPDPGESENGLAENELLNDSKPVNLTRKGIRYVDMHDPVDNAHSRPNSLNQLPPVYPCHSDSVYRSINYDLTRALPPLLLHRTGPVERALDRKVWFELTCLIFRRVFSPLDYADHLTLDLISLLLPSGLLDHPEQSFKLGLLDPKNRRLRRDLYNRDNESRRVNILEFWFELAQCLLTISRDRHTLSTVLRAIFSSKIPKTVWQAAITGSNAKTAMAQELSACHRALGGEIQPERHGLAPASTSVSCSPVASVAQLSVNPFDFRNQIPNLNPLLTGSLTEPRGSTVNSSSGNGPIQDQRLPTPARPTEAMQTYLVKELWMWELHSTMQDVVSALFVYTPKIS